MAAKATIAIQNYNNSTGTGTTKSLGRAAVRANMTETDWQQLDTGCRALNGAITNNTYVDALYTVERSVNEELLGG